MRIHRIRSTSATEFISDDGQTMVLMSYSTPVAYHRSGDKPIVTDHQYSRTTTGHINQWLERHDFDRGACMEASENALATMFNAINAIG